MHPDLESYLSGALNSEARQRFEAELARDPALQAEVEQWRAVLPDSRWTAIERRVGEAQARLEQRRYKRRILLLLGSVALVLAALAGWWLRQQTSMPAPAQQGTEKPPVPDVRTLPQEQPAAPPKDQREPIATDPKGRKRQAPAYYAALATAAYEKPDFSFRSVTKNTHDPIEQALQAWEEDNWPKVIELMQPVPATDPSYLRARLLLAHALFREGRFAEAEANFAVLVKSGLPPWAEECEWFELLSRLGQGDMDNPRFQQELSRIAGKNDHPFQRQAQQLLRKL